MKKIISKTIIFLKEVKVELKRVTWPSRKDVLSATSLVLIITFIVAFFLGVVDLWLSYLVRHFLG
ncbi:MAG: preprotein translocase subunit SecE [Deltaproteobacteria bacterium]|nr:preprotein translocase subunit SecE [Deltaproteobacteria bacterium]